MVQYRLGRLHSCVSLAYLRRHLPTLNLLLLRHVCNVYVEHRGSRPDELAMITSETWREYNENPRIFAMSKDRALELLQSPFIAMPLNIAGNHWVLAIFAYAGHILDAAPDPHPVILLFDSLGTTPKKTYRMKLGRFLSSIVLRATTADHNPNKNDGGPADGLPLFAPNVSRPNRTTIVSMLTIWGNRFQSSQTVLIVDSIRHIF